MTTLPPPDEAGPPYVFDDTTVSSIRRRSLGPLGPARPALFSSALDPAKHDLRCWLDVEVARIAEGARDEVIGRLRDERLHSAAVSELAALALLRDEMGLQVSYETELFGRTPDILAAEPGRDDAAFIAEIWTRSVPPETFSDQRAWDDLGRAIGRIPKPHLLRVSGESVDRAGAPRKVTRDRIIRHLETHLPHRTGEPEWITTTNGLTFESVGRTKGNARMLPVTTSLSIDRNHVVGAIEDKVARYRHVAEEANLPFMVILSGEARTGLNEALVADVLKGLNVLAFSFDAWTTVPMVSRKQTLRRTEAPPDFDPALSAVAFLDVRDGHDAHAVIWRIAGARRALPMFSAGSHTRIREATLG